MVWRVPARRRVGALPFDSARSVSPVGRLAVFRRVMALGSVNCVVGDFSLSAPSAPGAQ
jgi:hypothetical protein